MFAPPINLTLGTPVPAPTPFYASTKVLNSDWVYTSGPCAMYASGLGKTVVTWQMVGANASGFKGTQVAAYDHASGTWSERYKALGWQLADDDHGYSSIVQDTDGYFYVFGGAHNTPIRWAVSTAANSISAWTQQASIGATLSYPSAVYVGSKIYLFMRSDSPTNERPLVVRTATPASGLATFGGNVSLVDLDTDSRVDFNTPQIVGTDIHIAATRPNSADTARKGVYYFVYDTTTGALKNHDGSFSTAAGSLPINLTTANAHYRLYDPGTGQGDIPALGFDTNGDPHIIYADNGGSGTNYNLMHIKRTAGVWSSPVVVDALAPQGTGVGGYVGVYNIVPGAAGQMEAWYFDSSGNKHRRIRGSDGVWGYKETILTAGSLQLVGEQPVRGGLPAFRSIFCEVDGLADATAQTVKRYGYGDNGPVTAAIPMATVDANYSSVSLLLGFEYRNAWATGLIDDSDSCMSAGIFNGNAQVDTAQSKFGNASLKLDGTGDYVTFPDDPLFRMPQDFTFECWVRLNANGRLQSIAGKRPATGTADWQFYILATNVLQVNAYATGSVTVVTAAGTTALATNTWYHVAFTRSGTTWRVFLNGALEATATESATPTPTTQLLHIGRDPTTTARDFNGWIDEVRITSGVARYTAAFTASVAAFPRR